ncbi:MAG: TIGR00366 family protein [Rubrobacter sp.]|nr:TIGR00366 family protein [Rubrobacter sp.]
MSSIIISLFIPLGGGHWIVQGSFMAPAASKTWCRPSYDGDGRGVR